MKSHLIVDIATTIVFALCVLIISAALCFVLGFVTRLCVEQWRRVIDERSE